VETDRELRVTFWECIFIIDCSLNRLIFSSLPVFFEIVVEEHSKEVSVEVYRIIYKLELFNGNAGHLHLKIFNESSEVLMVRNFGKGDFEQC